MAALGAGDFRKPASGGPYAGESRDIIFEKKIKEKKDFIIGATKNGKKVTGVKYEAKTRDFLIPLTAKSRSTWRYSTTSPLKHWKSSR